MTTTPTGPVFIHFDQTGSFLDQIGHVGPICFDTDEMSAFSLHPKTKDFELPLTEGPINFRVLRSDGLLSHRWGVDNNKKGDAYLYCRDVPNAEKVSFHASGKQHISLRPEVAKQFGKDSRFIKEWQEPELEREAIASYSLLFSPWAGGVHMDLGAIRKKDELLIVGHDEKTVVVAFLIVDAAKKLQGKVPHLVLGQLPLGSEKSLHVVAWKESSSDHFENEVKQHFPSVAMEFARKDISEGEYTIVFYGDRKLNSVFALPVQVRHTPKETPTTGP
ncbi:hypothetical protein [Candidatus Palauibacter sp.]|uniref:hypothetical protein n=1 Tax=Candidatus Palauibacter sp. TaxID=3101350 RepID=UPI003B51AE21